MIRCTIAISIIATLILSPALAEDRIDLGTTVRGNKEAPKALYIVPWKSLSPVDMVDLEAETLLAEELAPIDRESFRRRIELHEITQGVIPDDATKR